MNATTCNRSACKRELPPNDRWWNTSTRAWYCRSCAFAINRANDDLSPRPICIHEVEKLRNEKEECESVARDRIRVEACGGALSGYADLYFGDTHVARISAPLAKQAADALRHALAHELRLRARGETPPLETDVARANVWEKIQAYASATGGETLRIASVVAVNVALSELEDAARAARPMSALEAGAPPRLDAAVPAWVPANVRAELSAIALARVVAWAALDVRSEAARKDESVRALTTVRLDAAIQALAAHTVHLDKDLHWDRFLHAVVAAAIELRSNDRAGEGVVEARLDEALAAWRQKEMPA